MNFLPIDSSFCAWFMSAKVTSQQSDTGLLQLEYRKANHIRHAKMNEIHIITVYKSN